MYFKGNVSIRIGESTFQIGELRQGLGISGEDIGKVCFEDGAKIRRVFTIENLTTFFRWEEAESLMIYLGGYHNSVRRMLLQKIYHRFPDACYCHFGDIDVGGFLIYGDLCRKTGIPFKRYRMDLDTLKEFEEYGKPLTENDRAGIERILKEKPDVQYADVLGYMLAAGVKLEQECYRLNTE